MHDAGRFQRPASRGFHQRGLNGFFCHALVVLDAETRQLWTLRVAPDISRKAGNRPDIRITAAQRVFQRTRIEIALLEADREHRIQPPVTGGKNATSSSLASCATSDTTV